MIDEDSSESDVDEIIIERDYLEDDDDDTLDGYI
jgi:hypothetical protein